MSSSPKQIGRIVGEASPETFIFVARKNDHPPKYEYVSIFSNELVGDEIRRVQVLAQVTGIASRSDAYRSDLDYDTLEKIYNAGIDDVNVLCVARTLGYIAKDGKHKRIYLPRRAIYPGNPVYLAPDSLVREFFSYSVEEGLHIGHLISRPSIDVYISVNGFRRHIALIAQTGAGKSYTLGVMLEELLRLGATAIVIDPHADYVFLSRTPDMRRHMFSDRIYVFRNPDSTGRYDPEDIDNLRELTFKFSELEVDDIARIAGISEKWTKIRGAIEVAINNLRNKKKNEYSLEDLLEELKNIANSGSDRRKNINAAGAALYLRRLKKLRVFGDRTVPIKEILIPFHVSVIDLSGLNDASQDYIVYRILEDIVRLRVQQEFEWPVFVFIEEAHKFVPRKDAGVKRLSASVINMIAAEGRKFGVFLTLVTQRPNKINSDTLSQCNSQIILRITNPNDQRAVQMASERLGEDLMRDLCGLNVGEAIIVGELTRVPVMVRVRRRISAEGGADIDVVEELKRARLLMRERKTKNIVAPENLVFSEV